VREVQDFDVFEWQWHGWILVWRCAGQGRPRDVVAPVATARI